MNHFMLSKPRDHLLGRSKVTAIEQYDHTLSGLLEDRHLAKA